MLRVFGYAGEAAEEMTYLNWLHQLQMALASLVAYNTEHRVWTQAHCCARHVYLQVLLREAPQLVSIQPQRNEEGVGEQGDHEE